MNKPIGSTLHKSVEMSSIHSDAYQALCITPTSGAEHQLHLSTARDMEKLGLALGFITEAHPNLPIYHHEGEWVGYDEAEQEAYRNLNYWLVREKLLTHLRCLDMKVMPEAGATWKHRNGLEYEVLMISNQYSDKPEYRATVVYRGPNGKVWSKEFGNFIEKMTFVAGPNRSPCQPEEALTALVRTAKFTQGDTYRAHDGKFLTDVWTAGINVETDDKECLHAWGNRIEAFGDTEQIANSLRDRILQLLTDAASASGVHCPAHVDYVPETRIPAVATVYQCREIGEGDWRDCTVEEYVRYSQQPEMDTCIKTQGGVAHTGLPLGEAPVLLAPGEKVATVEWQKPGICGEPACTMTISQRCITPKLPKE